MTPDTGHWQRRLADLAARHHVPGASLAILHDGEISTAVTGLLNVATGAPVTPDSVFQIGSITKIWTTMLILQLADEGKLELDTPLPAVLPELALATPGATDQITVRHLLTHASGIDGDMFDDFGRGTDAIQRYVAGCSRLTLTHPVGATMSYCNAGFVIAGRIVEVLTGKTFDEVLRARLIGPLGLTRTVTIAEEAIRFPVAYGHQITDGVPGLTPIWALPGGTLPAGGITASAADVVTFARAHLDGGVTADGTRLLPEATVTAMQQPQVEVPSYPPGARQVGLGWQLHNWTGHRLYGHTGGTIGQFAYLYVLPDQQGAVCLLTNSSSQPLFQDLFTEIFAGLWQVGMPAPPGPAADPAGIRVEPGRYLGRYEREGTQMVVRQAGDGLELTVTDTGPLAATLPDPEETVQLLPVAEDVFAARSEPEDPWTILVFYQVDGRDYIHSGGRATPRHD